MGAEPQQEGARQRLVFALDYPSLDEARAGAERVRDAVGVVKVGLELFVRAGPAAVRLGPELGLDVFLDLKLHDIPATVGRAVARAADLGVRYLTVHAGGGSAMLRHAVEAADGRLSIVAVTVLTSLDQSDLTALGLDAAPAQHAVRLAALAWRSGVRDFVCSAAEVAALRAELGPEATLITPGIRPAGGQTQDQKRVATPARAIGDGANLLVVGRPIRDAADPAAAARTIVEQIALAAAGHGST